MLQVKHIINKTSLTDETKSTIFKELIETPKTTIKRPMSYDSNDPMPINQIQFS